MAIFTPTYNTSINLCVINDTLLENTFIFNKRRNLEISLYTGRTDAHPKNSGGRVKIYFGEAPKGIKSHAFITLGKLMTRKKEDYDESWVEGDHLDKMESSHKKVIKALITRCGDSLLDYYLDKITEDELIKILREKIPEYYIFTHSTMHKIDKY